LKIVPKLAATTRTIKSPSTIDDGVAIHPEADPQALAAQFQSQKAA
jgi:hypothetical protein